MYNFSIEQTEKVKYHKTENGISIKVTNKTTYINEFVNIDYYICSDNAYHILRLSNNIKSIDIDNIVTIRVISFDKNTSATLVDFTINKSECEIKTEYMLYNTNYCILKA